MTPLFLEGIISQAKACGYLIITFSFLKRLCLLRKVPDKARE